MSAALPCPRVVLPSGVEVPALGLGTWRMGEQRSKRGAEVAALRHGIERGVRLIDTAEMYGEGAAEEIVADAMAGHRDELYIVSKVYPHNASRRGTVAACERSLARLRTDRIDLYLLHWRGNLPLQETVDALEDLRESGKIGDWGVSNFDTDDMEELLALRAGHRVASNQVLFSLVHRSAEWDLEPFCRERSIALMAYSPVGQGALARHAGLAALASRIGATPCQVALAWLLRRPGTIVIPKASRTEHVDDDLGALGVVLDDDALAEIDRLFPPPRRKRPLEML